VETGNLETDRFRGATIVVVKQWGTGKQMCKKMGTVLRRNYNEENKKHILLCKSDVQ
jgi:hypothetical protein